MRFKIYALAMSTILYFISEIFCGKSHSCAHSWHKRGCTDRSTGVHPTTWSVLRQVPAAAAPGIPYQGKQAGCLRQTRHYGCISVSIDYTVPNNCTVLCVIVKHFSSLSWIVGKVSVNLSLIISKQNVLKNIKYLNIYQTNKREI